MTMLSLCYRPLMSHGRASFSLSLLTALILRHIWAGDGFSAEKTLAICRARLDLPCASAATSDFHRGDHHKGVPRPSQIDLRSVAGYRYLIDTIFNVCANTSSDRTTSSDRATKFSREVREPVLSFLCAGVNTSVGRLALPPSKPGGEIAVSLWTHWRFQTFLHRVFLSPLVWPRSKDADFLRKACVYGKISDRANGNLKVALKQRYDLIVRRYDRLHDEGGRGFLRGELQATRFLERKV